MITHQYRYVKYFWDKTAAAKFWSEIIHYILRKNLFFSSLKNFKFGELSRKLNYNSLIVLVHSRQALHTISVRLLALHIETLIFKYTKLIEITIEKECGQILRPYLKDFIQKSQVKYPVVFKQFFHPIKNFDDVQVW